MNLLCKCLFVCMMVTEVSHAAIVGQASRQVRQSTSQNKTWSSSNDNNLSVEDLKVQCGFKMSKSANSSRQFSMAALPGARVMACKDASCLPKTFSWLDNKIRCPSLGHIRNQGKCGSCWAVASAAVLSDRHCLRTNEQVIFSSKEICGCADGNACGGGDPKDAMNYYVDQGVVTGGDPTVKDQEKGCQPYPTEKPPKIRCEHQCDSTYSVQFQKDKRTGGNGYAITSRDIDEIKIDLLKYGPLVATMLVFEDFSNYEKGIYQHEKGALLGFHAVRLIGWGEENQTPYWMVANSYGENWGEDGFFRIILGKNECLIEDYLVGADTDQSHRKHTGATAHPTTTNPPTTTGIETEIDEHKGRTPFDGGYIPLPILCDVASKSSVSFAVIKSNSGTLNGNSNIVCHNSGTVNGTNNIICHNVGQILGRTNMVCSQSAVGSKKIAKCDSNGRKMCNICKEDKRLNDC